MFYKTDSCLEAIVAMKSEQPAGLKYGLICKLIS